MTDICFPTDGSGVVVALRAFLDGSEKNGVFSVAGFAFGMERARKAQNRWKKLHGDRVLHMTDLHARKKAFENETPESAGLILKKKCRDHPGSHEVWRCGVG